MYLCKSYLCVFQHLYNVHLSQEKVDCSMMMMDNVKTLLCACDAVSVDTARLKLLLQVSYKHQVVWKSL